MIWKLISCSLFEPFWILWVQKNPLVLLQLSFCLWNSTDKLHTEGNPMQMWPYPQSSAIHRNHIRVSLQLVLNTPDVNSDSTRCPSCKSTGGSSLKMSLWWNSRETKKAKLQTGDPLECKTKRGWMLFRCNTSLETHNMCDRGVENLNVDSFFFPFGNSGTFYVCSEDPSLAESLVIKHILEITSSRMRCWTALSDLWSSFTSLHSMCKQVRGQYEVRGQSLVNWWLPNRIS